MLLSTDKGKQVQWDPIVIRRGEPDPPRGWEFPPVEVVHQAALEDREERLGRPLKRKEWVCYPEQDSVAGDSVERIEGLADHDPQE